MNSIKSKNRIDIIFMNSRNNKTSDAPRHLILNMLLYQILAFTKHGKYKKAI